MYWSFVPQIVADQFIISNGSGDLINTGKITQNSGCQCTGTVCSCSDVFMGDVAGQTIALTSGHGTISNGEESCSGSIPKYAYTISGSVDITAGEQIDFSVLGNVCGGGNSYWELEVSCDPITNRTYKKLSELEFFDDGSEVDTAEGDLVDVMVSVETHNQFLLFPNPASKLLNIKNPDLVGEYNLQRLDINGRLIFEEKDIDQKIFKINLTDLVSGIYLVSFSYQGSRSIQRLAVE